MANVQISMEVSKELMELADGVAAFLKVLKTESMDGFDITDLSSIMASAMTDLLPALEGVSKIVEEAVDDRGAFVNASAYAGAKIINSVL